MSDKKQQELDKAFEAIDKLDREDDKGSEPSQAFLALVVDVDSAGSPVVVSIDPEVAGKRYRCITSTAVSSPCVGDVVIVQKITGVPDVHAIALSKVKRELIENSVLATLENEDSSVSLNEILEKTESSQSISQLRPASASKRETEELARRSREKRFFGASEIIESPDGIVLKTGLSSIALYADGRVTINGRVITQNATLTNQIMGGSIQLN